MSPQPHTRDSGREATQLLESQAAIPLKYFPVDRHVPRLIPPLPLVVCHSLTQVQEGCPCPLSASPDVLHSPDCWPHSSHSSSLSEVFIHLTVVTGHLLCASTVRNCSWEQNRYLEFSFLWGNTVLPACPSVRKKCILTF